MGILDNITILRFSHAFKLGGGIETYIDNLDRTLLKRNKITIIRLYLSNEKLKERGDLTIIGKGRLIEVPLKYRSLISHGMVFAEKNSLSFKNEIISLIRDYIFYNPYLYKFFFKEFLKNRANRSRFLEAQNVSEVIEYTTTKYDVKLVVMHHIGGKDGASVVMKCVDKKIPFITLNHYSNNRLNYIPIREQMRYAHGIAGVTSVNVPKRLKNVYMNLSDGIDLDYFKQEKTNASTSFNNTLVIINPARVIPSKGQKDLIKSANYLKLKSFKFKIIFAGRVDSHDYYEDLKKLVAKLELEKYIVFLGELKSRDIRNLYRISSMMVLPTYHHEGLPRTLLEAQAMNVPIIAYDVGGVSEGIIDGKTGYLVKKGDLNALVKRIEDLLINDDKRKKMGENGKLFVLKNFSLLSLARRHENFYALTINSSKKFEN